MFVMQVFRNFRHSTSVSNNNGFAPILIIVAVLGVITFLAISNIAPFKSKFFASLFPKDSSFAAGAVTITNTSTGKTIQTQLSTNLVWSGMVDQTPGAQDKLNGLKAPLLRIHVGDDGYPIAMPETKKGIWDFKALDALVNNTFATGQEPLMNIKFAPDWQWTCTRLYSSGTIRDTSFNEYAEYMARLVSYYNKGSMTTESGSVITNPAGTSHKITWWELWNEPDLNNETPCAPPTGVGLTSAQYVTMWNAVTAKMLAVDPSLKFAGPATAGAQFGSTSSTGNQYIDDLMSGSVTKPSALSFHGYGYWDNGASDKWLFDGDNSEVAAQCCGGVLDLLNGVKRIRSKYPNLPVWISEVNVNAAWGDDPAKRPWSELGAAWWGTMFAQVAPEGAGIIHHYDYIESPQFGLLDDQGHPFISYYVFQLLNQSFPQGSTLLSANSDIPEVLTLAVQKPDKSISVLVVNRKVSSGVSKCGTGGSAVSVPVTLSGFNPTSVTLQQIDKSNVNCTANPSVASAPINKTLDPTQPININFPGYGIAVLNITSNGQTPASPSPVSSVVTSPTPISTPSPSSTPTPSPALNKISGFVYVDLNQNKKKDAAEPRYTGATTLTLSGTANSTTTTNSTGNYSFANLIDGNYSVTLTVPSGYKSTNSNPQTKTLTATNASANFGIVLVSTPNPSPTINPSPTTQPTPTPSSSTGAGLTIYDNSVSSLFTDNTFSYSAKNACDTSTFTSSNCSYSATFKSYGAYEFRYKSGSITASSYKSLDFNINTGGQAITNFGVILSTSAGGYINEYFLTSANVAENLGNGWVRVSIPMSTLNSKNTNIGVISIENAKNASIPQIRIDDVKLLP